MDTAKLDQLLAKLELMLQRIDQLEARLAAMAAKKETD